MSGSLFCKVDTKGTHFWHHFVCYRPRKSRYHNKHYAFLPGWHLLSNSRLVKSASYDPVTESSHAAREKAFARCVADGEYLARYKRNIDQNSSSAASHVSKNMNALVFGLLVLLIAFSIISLLGWVDLQGQCACCLQIMLLCHRPLRHDPKKHMKRVQVYIMKKLGLYMFLLDQDIWYVCH